MAPGNLVRGCLQGRQAGELFGQLSTGSRGVWPKILDDYKIPDDQVKAWQAERDSFIAGKELGEPVSLEDRGSHPDPRDLHRDQLNLVLRGVYTSIDEANIFFHNKYLENSWLGNSGSDRDLLS